MHQNLSRSTADLKGAFPPKEWSVSRLIADRRGFQCYENLLFARVFDDFQSKSDPVLSTPNVFKIG